MTVWGVVRARLAVYLVLAGLIAAVIGVLALENRDVARAEDREHTAAFEERTAIAHYRHTRALLDAARDSVAAAERALDSARTHVAVVDSVTIRVNDAPVVVPPALVNYVLKCEQLAVAIPPLVTASTLADSAADSALVVQARHTEAVAAVGRAKWRRGFAIGAAIGAGGLILLRLVFGSRP